jgi:ArsR family transcriptional regulator, arsenate/arsenite/antimonite-responsive transcriptional repressor
MGAILLAQRMLFLYSLNYFDIIRNMDKSTAIVVLGALAQDTRLEIFRHLTQTGPQPAGRIGERFGLPLATLSFHLHALKQAGLLSCRREGRQLIYQAQCDVIAELMRYLTEHCCPLPTAGQDGEPSSCVDSVRVSKP